MLKNLTSRGCAHERVAGGQDHEVKYEAKEEGVSKGEVKQTVKEVGGPVIVSQIFRFKIDNALTRGLYGDLFEELQSEQGELSGHRTPC
ncbi:DUF3606 domain-containing protein [Rhizobium leguminosarum]|nr:DUF3606 domain-containing protein [Rhizobium leguminosarum]